MQGMSQEVEARTLVKVLDCNHPNKLCHMDGASCTMLELQERIPSAPPLLHRSIETVVTRDRKVCFMSFSIVSG